MLTSNASKTLVSCAGEPVYRTETPACCPDDEAPDTTSTLSFTLFPKLPQEIRLQIWRATFRPQKVIMRVESDGSITPGGASAPPKALHICSESRQEALNCYWVLFKDELFPTFFNPLIDIPHIRHGSESHRRVAFDPVVPNFNFSRAFLSSLKKLFDASFLSSLRRLAIDRDIWVLRMGSAPKVLGLFGKLEELFIVIDDLFLRDEDEWYDADESDSNDYINVYLNLHGRDIYGYHGGEERNLYNLFRGKQLGSNSERSHFVEPQASLIYAAYVKEDVLANLNEGAELRNPLKHPEVRVVAEVFDKTWNAPTTLQFLDTRG